MKEFIIKVIKFLLVLPIYFCLNGLINLFIYSISEPELDESNILIIGDSHPQKSLNPDLFHDAHNISQSAEPLVLSYWKANYFLEEAEIDTLIIGIGHHNISAYNDIKFSNDQWSFEMFKRSYPIENLESIDENLEIDYIDYYKTVWKETAFFPKNDHFHFIGDFESSSESNISDSSITVKRHYYKDNRVIGFSETSIAHLFSIIKLCKAENIEPIVIFCPVHVAYFNKIPLTYKNKLNEIKQQLQSRGVIVIDKSVVDYPDSLFLNSSHLNKYGAERFTKEVNRLL